jgi:V8-like Glu-specific endopeptidase
MATGWMISSDVLVTAGHCAYDWGFNLGRARTIKAYLGYKNGKWSQFRTGKMIATTAGWLEGSKNKTKDVSFVQLESAFNNVVPFQYTSTPLANTEDLYIVGYPADKVDPKTKERGGQMYVGSGSVTYDLRQSDLMLSYHISTAGGKTFYTQLGLLKLIDLQRAIWFTSPTFRSSHVHCGSCPWRQADELGYPNRDIWELVSSVYQGF